MSAAEVGEPRLQKHNAGGYVRAGNDAVAATWMVPHFQRARQHLAMHRHAGGHGSRHTSVHRGPRRLRCSKWHLCRIPPRHSDTDTLHSADLYRVSGTAQVASDSSFDSSAPAVVMHSNLAWPAQHAWTTTVVLSIKSNVIYNIFTEKLMRNGAAMPAVKLSRICRASWRWLLARCACSPHPAWGDPTASLLNFAHQQLITI